jgi:GH15 family glucan-1,4-alpha-glucosidase
VRDATFTLLGFIHAGFYEEARQWTNWLMRSIAGSANQIQVMYGPAGERLLQEWRIPWLTGYRGATPVRIGNAASEQLQLDIFGELADVFHQARVSVGDGSSNFDLLRNLLTYLQKIWRKGDHGIWEIRGEGRHFTHSKVMSWVAFDRAIKTAELYQLDAPMQEWHATRREIHDDVCRRGFNKRLNSFVRTYGSDEVDASLLLIPIVGFLPPLDPRVVGTVRRIEKRLLRGGLVFRFENKKAAPGASRSEGAFLPCSFWLADYYELADRTREAKRLLNRLLSIRNDLGLLAEEYNVREKRLVGNFPQALTHVALVNTVLNLHAKRGPVHQRSSM